MPLRKQKKLSALIIGMVLCINSATANNIKVTKDIEFAVVNNQSLKLDLYQPKKPKGTPLVVWIHGGGWRKGTKERCYIDWLPKHGYTVASISYRYSSVAKFPAQIHDCKGAVRWLRANAEKYGYNPKKIFVAGSSAGGHLTALMATTSENKELEGAVGGNLKFSSVIQGAVVYYGATDFILRSKTQPSRANAKGSVGFYFKKQNPTISCKRKGISWILF